MHIAMSHITEAVLEGKLPKDKKLVTICFSGGRCLAVNQYLKSNGYDADYLEGGMLGLGK
jgi:rhodanese-related sulfurtransferase